MYFPRMEDTPDRHFFNEKWKEPKLNQYEVLYKSGKYTHRVTLNA